MSDTLGTYSFLPVAAPRRRQQRSPRPTATRRSSCAPASASTLKLTGQPRRAAARSSPPASRATSRSTGRATSSASTARAIVQGRAAPLDHQLRAQLPAVHRVLRRGLPLALHAGRADAGEHRLRPWLTLVVLKEDEFKDVDRRRVAPAAGHRGHGEPRRVFPPADQLWAWAHVHVNQDLVAQDGVDRLDRHGRGAGASSRRLLRSNPDLAYSRLRLPAPARRRTPATTPSSCRASRAGGWPGSASTRRRQRRVLRDALGLGRLSGPPACRPCIPYYHRWYFRTGTVGDFEYLVRLLKPRPADARVGTARHGRAGAGLEPSRHRRARAGRRAAARRRAAGARRGADRRAGAEADALRGLGPALPARVPGRRWRAFVNLADDYAAATPATPDPRDHARRSTGAGTR